MNDAVFTSNIERVRSGLDLLSTYISQSEENPRDPAALELIEHLRSSIEELDIVQNELKQQTDALLAGRQQGDLERRRYQELFSFAPYGYLVTNSKGVILEANRQAALILNTQSPFLLNLPLSVYIPRADWRKFLGLLNICRRMVEDRQDIEPGTLCFEEQELKIKPLRLAAIIAMVSAVVAVERDDYVVRWSIRDITSERRVQEDLRESEMKFRNLAETTAGAILIVQDGRILYANPMVSKMLAVSMNNLIGQPFERFLFSADRWLFVQWTDRVANDPAWQPQNGNSNGFHHEIRFLSASNQVWWADMTAGILNMNDKVAWVITAFDINARVESDRVRTELLHRLVSAQEEERRRISRELHDQVGQMIGAINLGLKSLDGSSPGEAHEKLASLRGLINDLSLGIQRMALDLRPPALDDLGLPLAVEDYLEDWSKRNQIPVDFQCNIPKDLSLTGEVKIAVYRIIQEALTNIQKHAEASNVSVILDRHSSQLVIVVEDDGKGFNLQGFQKTPHAKEHLGLIGMQERAELIGGRLDVESTPDRGTSIFIHVPLTEKVGWKETHGENPDTAGG